MEQKWRRVLRYLGITLVVILMLIAGWILYDQNVDRSGWVEQDGFYAYKDFHGKKITGWLRLEEDYYYFDDSFFMVTGWQELDGNKYYFGTDGIMDLGWKDLDSRRYYFGADGILRTGWLTLEGNRYYLDSDGAMVTGWQELDGGTRYFNEEGILYTDWRVIDGETYYLGPDGLMVTGYVTLDGQNYYFQDNGIMFYGWEEVDGRRRFYARDGIQAFGWTELEGKWYFFGEDGLTTTGWHQEGEYSYYLLEDGSAAAGPQKIDGQLYYFTPKGIMTVLVNADHKVPSYHEKNLVTYTSWHSVSNVALEPMKQMLSDCEAAGYPYEFNSAYRSLDTQQLILTTRTQEYVDAGYPEGEAYAIARQTVALPGTSEHHLGLAVDIVNIKDSEKKAQDWLAQHCWDYGFILRYPGDKAHITGITNEPWHFRYVGTRVSLDMRDSGLCLEEYLGAAAVADTSYLEIETN